MRDRSICKRSQEYEQNDRLHLSNDCRAAGNFKVFAHAGKVGFQAFRFGELRYGFRKSSRLEKRSSKSIVSFGVIGIGAERSLEFRYRIVAPAQRYEQK